MINKVNRNYPMIFLFLVFSILSASPNLLFASEISTLGLHVIPYPRQVKTGGPDFTFKNELTVVLDKDPSVSDRFTADELIRDLKKSTTLTTIQPVKSLPNSASPCALNKDQVTGYIIFVKKVHK